MPRRPGFRRLPLAAVAWLLRLGAPPLAASHRIAAAAGAPVAVAPGAIAPGLRLRVFDIGGTGTKTALLTSDAVSQLLQDRDAAVEWVEAPRQLGLAPGEDGYAQWLRRRLPELKAELKDSATLFGVSTAGRLEQNSGHMGTWYGGGHVAGGATVAEIMGLPANRTFAVHDGSAHLIACARQLPPLPPKLAVFSLGTGVGFGLTDASGLAIDRLSKHGSKAMSLCGTTLSGAPYDGVWESWFDSIPKDRRKTMSRLLEEEFGGTHRPFDSPWVSLVLGSRGFELATAGFDDPADPFAQQWLHFLHSDFLPAFDGRVEAVSFAGGIVEHNWDSMRGALVDPTGALRPWTDGGRAPAPITVLPPAPQASGLVGAGIYAVGAGLCGYRFFAGGR